MTDLENGVLSLSEAIHWLRREFDPPATVSDRLASAIRAVLASAQYVDVARTLRDMEASRDLARAEVARLQEDARAVHEYRFGRYHVLRMPDAPGWWGVFIDGRGRNKGKQKALCIGRLGEVLRDARERSAAEEG